MMALLKRTVDQVLGRGESAITVPPMDGPLKPNRAIEDAAVVAQFDNPQDMAWDGEAIWVADGCTLLRMEPGKTCTLEASYERPITALAFVSGIGVLAALEGGDLRAPAGGQWKTGPREVDGRPLAHINSMSPGPAGTVLVTEGSRDFPVDQWSHDLLSLGRSGRVCQLSADASRDREMAGGLKYAFGALRVGGETWVSESWGHQLIAVKDGGQRRPARIVLDRLPAYPSRLAHAASGGAWLSLFAARTRLTEFVLREPEYRHRMMKEVDPRYWVAPALSSGNSFLEPLQGGSVKQLGIMKPWAPPRSYGLVVRLGADGLPLFSLHSRADGRHHGIVAVAEAGDGLYVLAKGSRSLLRIDLDALPTETPL